jgi:multiple sugar transport system ATP-binding protein
MDQIRLTGIRKSYGKEVAIHQLDLTVNPGEFLTILGPSGCGKTTMLRSIAGLEEPDEGEIQLGDRIVFSRGDGKIIPPEARGLGLIFQSYALWPHMTVEKNITLALKEKKLPKSDVEDRLINALDMVQMTELRSRYPSELSGGQQQRVAVARLIALRPSILLMDEPLSNLDAKLRTEMRTELKRLHRDLEATTVYVTHDQIEALTLSDRIIVMNKGRVMQEGTPYDIYHHPSNLFVAEFIGDPRMNFFSGIVVDEEGKQHLDCGDLTLPIPANLAKTGQELKATIRPEAIEVSNDAKEGWLQVTAESVQPTGAYTIMQVHAGKTAFTLVQPGFITMDVGEPLWITIDTGLLNFFDTTSGDNLSGSISKTDRKLVGK